MSRFEQACTDTQRSAETAAKAATSVVRAARQLAKAAETGDIAKLRRAMENLKVAELASRQESRNAELAWPFRPEDEETYLRDGFEAELIAAGEQRGLAIRKQDEHLVAFPSLLRVLPEQRAVQVDRTKVTAIRPSRLAELLERNQSKKPRFKPEQFIETLYRAYQLVVGSAGVQGTTLAEVYRALTLLPGAAKEYDKSDFARDLFFLDRSDVIMTKSGARISLPASTGTKGSASLFTFVAPDGEAVVYYGVKFTGGAA